MHGVSHLSPVRALFSVLMMVITFVFCVAPLFCFAFAQLMATSPETHAIYVSTIPRLWLTVPPTVAFVIVSITFWDFVRQNKKYGARSLILVAIVLFMFNVIATSIYWFQQFRASVRESARNKC